MARKLIVDCDPGIDDAVALCMALFDPRLDVVAVTATGGNVSGDQASRNVQALIERLDPPRYPRVGLVSLPKPISNIDARFIHGEDGLGNQELDVSVHHHQHAADKLIIDEIRAAPNEVTLLCLGPLTNVARAFQRDPELPSLVNRLVIMGGSVSGIGNITPTAEFNICVDPTSAQQVFQARTTKTLVPLDITSQVGFTLDLKEDLPVETTRAGALLHPMMSFIFRSYHQHLGQESIHLHDAVALVAVVNPELFRTTEMFGQVETRGQLTSGMTVFDRRLQSSDSPNMEVATEVDVMAAMNCIVRGLAHAGRMT
ncbi:MAG: nucleoside hydrolase [Planctomycetaceae bacterium]|nr:nucleoside hydrolase [Planctomycetaceae bacterium]